MQWVKNFTSKVRFYQSFKRLCTSTSSLKKGLPAVSSKADIDMILEIGPHSALKGPIRSTTTELAEQNRLGYASSLIKGINACKTMLSLVGTLFTRGFSTDFRLVNFPNGTTKRNVSTYLAMHGIIRHHFGMNQESVQLIATGSSLAIIFLVYLPWITISWNLDGETLSECLNAHG
jgi:hypothetical protein